MAISTLRTTSQLVTAAAAIWATIALLAPAGLIDAAQAAPLYPAASDQVHGNAAIPVRGFVAVAPRSAVVVRSGPVVRSGTVVRGGTMRGGTVVRSGTVVTGPRGNVAAVRGAAVVRPGRWSRPGWYHWPRGGAIAAGAALGYLAAASAVAYGPSPEPGMCWYYTNLSHTRGFWDYCP